jgi:hypothetical protein
MLPVPVTERPKRVRLTSWIRGNPLTVEIVKLMELELVPGEVVLSLAL